MGKVAFAVLSLVVVCGPAQAQVYCLLCMADIPVDDTLAAFMPVPGGALLPSNGPMLIDKRITVHVIQTAHDSGSPAAPDFGTPEQRQAITDRVDEIMAQAGVDVEFIFEPTVAKSTIAYQGNTSPRPCQVNELGLIAQQVALAGVQAQEWPVLNMFLVGAIPCFGLLDGIVAGYAGIGNRLSAIYASPIAVAGSPDIVAAVVAHEIGHNCWLRHNDVDTNNLMRTSAAVQGLLVESQINSIRGSPWAQPLDSTPPILTAVRSRKVHLN